MSGRTAIIHIGTPKTGSTSIQKVLKTHRAALPQQGAAYPRSPGNEIHRLLTFAASGPPFKATDRTWDGMQPAARLDRFNHEFAAEMQQLPASVQRVIFSSEGFCVTLRSQAQIANLRAVLQPYFDQFMIVIYLRRQDQLLASQYTQMLRIGHLHAPDATFDVSSNFHYYNYDAMLRKWATVFGQAAIKPRIYEAGPQGPFDSVADFNNLCALTLTPGARTRSTNPSISVAGQTILREVGAILQQNSGGETVAGPAWRIIGAGVTKALPGRGWTPSPEESRAFLARFEAGNEALRQLYHPDRPTLFSNYFPPQEGPRQDLSDRALFTAACHALLESTAARIARANALARAARQKAAGEPALAPALADDDTDPAADDDSADE